jgi:hypothetical protein
MTFVYRQRVTIPTTIETARVAAVAAEARAAALERRMSYSGSSTASQIRDLQAWRKLGR